MRTQRIQAWHEPWFIRRLHERGVEIPDGIADLEQRRELIRDAIIKHDLADAPIGRAGEVGNLTYRYVFERIYAGRNGLAVLST